ncbi:MAG: hypothetical protein M3O71_20140 [Bacteroidota bacterium]|nr:hypothetical protein [Bacteroidota bacterium]
MKKNTIAAIVIILFVLGFIVFVIVTIQQAAVQDELNQRKRMEIVGKIQFKGRVISSNIYDYGGKPYYFVCIKLDSSNTKNYYIYNDLCGFKIKNGIATMALGVVNDAVGTAIYVEANTNNKNKIILHYKNGDTDEYMFTLDPRGLKENDLNACN